VGKYNVKPGSNETEFTARDLSNYENTVSHLSDTELLAKKLATDEEVRSLRKLISEADAERHNSGVYAEITWYRNTHDRVKMLGKHSQMLQGILSERKTTIKNTRVQIAEISQNLRLRAVGQVLRALLSEDQLSVIWAMTDARHRELERCRESGIPWKPMDTCPDRLTLDADVRNGSK